MDAIAHNTAGNTWECSCSPGTHPIPANSRALPPAPPTGALSIEVVSVSVHALAVLLDRRHQLRANRVHVRFVHGPVAGASNSIRVARSGPPEVRHVAIEIVDRLDLAGTVWSSKQNSSGPRERLDVVGNGCAKPAPHHIRHAGLAAEPWKRCLQV
jgi:hypothetical protein